MCVLHWYNHRVWGSINTLKYGGIESHQKLHEFFTNLHHNLYQLAVLSCSVHCAYQVFHPTTGNLLYHLGDETMPRYPVVSLRFKKDKDDDPVRNFLLATCKYLLSLCEIDNDTLVCIIKCMHTVIWLWVSIIVYMFAINSLLNYWLVAMVHHVFCRQSM